MHGSMPEPVAASVTAPQPAYYPDPGMAQSDFCFETGHFDTITESIFGHPDPNCWRPLPLSTFFSEGWNESWEPSPNGFLGFLRNSAEVHPPRMTLSHS